MSKQIPNCDGRSAYKGMHALQNGNGETEIGSVYDIASQTFTPFHFSTNAFCAGHSVAEDGTVIIAGKQPLVGSSFSPTRQAHISGSGCVFVRLRVCMHQVLTHVSGGVFVHLSVRVSVRTMS